MNINIRVQQDVKIDYTAPFETVPAEPGLSLEEIVKLHVKDPQYRILLARVNNVDRELTYVLRDCDEDCRIDFLDMRTLNAALAYQRSLSMIYIMAVKEVYAECGMDYVDVCIDNSLNKGFYTRLDSLDPDKEVDTSDLKEKVKLIDARMREIIKADLPIVFETRTREEGLRKCAEEGFYEKVKLLEGIHSVDYKVKLYRIGEYRNYFYGLMLPSTGYVDLFELKAYHNGILVRFPYYSKPDEIPKYVDDSKLFEAFDSERSWLDLLNSNYIHELNDVIIQGKIKDHILLSEALHEKKIAEIADEIKKKGKRIILIAGPSSSGKTTTAKRLCVQLRVNGLEPLYLGTDDYFVEREDTPRDAKGNYNYEDLEALDIKLFNDNMNDLLAGKEVDLPEFDFMEGKKVYGKRITSISSSQPIVIEGIHALNGALTEQIDDKEKFRIYISPFVQLNIDRHNRLPSTDMRMLRRMIRDYKYRGRSAATTIRDWPSVRAGEDKNIFPYNREADVTFNTVLAYEIAIVKRIVTPLLEAIRPEDPEYSEAVRLLSFLRFFIAVDEDEYVPNNSIIREFIGGSVFVE